MPNKSPNSRKHTRPLDVILSADYVRLVDEAPLRYPLSRSKMFVLKNEGRIKTYGSPAMINCAEFEAAMKRGFPVLTERQPAAAD